MKVPLVTKKRSLATAGNQWSRLLAHSPRLRLYLRKALYGYLSNHLSLEDLVAETLRYAQEHPEQWSHIPDERLFFYLRHMARLKILQAAKKYRSHWGTLVEDPRTMEEVQGPARQGPTPMKNCHQEEKHLALRRILARLKNESHRQVLNLVWLQGKTVAEAGANLGRSSSATQKLLERAFQACRTIARRHSFRGFRVSGETV